MNLELQIDLDHFAQDELKNVLVQINWTQHEMTNVECSRQQDCHQEHLNMTKDEALRD